MKSSQHCCWGKRSNIIIISSSKNLSLLDMNRVLQCPLCLAGVVLPWGSSTESSLIQHQMCDQWSWQFFPSDASALPCSPSARAADTSHWNHRLSYEDLRKPATPSEPLAACDTCTQNDRHYHHHCIAIVINIPEMLKYSCTSLFTCTFKSLEFIGAI